MVSGSFVPRAADIQGAVGWEGGVGSRVVPGVSVLWASGVMTVGGGLMSIWRTQTVQVGAGMGHTPPRKKREVWVGSVYWALAIFWKEPRRRL